MIDRFEMHTFGVLRWEDLSVETSGSQDGSCDCCGTNTRRVWGFVRHPRGPVAAYFVGWTLGKKDHGATFDLIVGPWGEGARPERRGAVSLRYAATDESSGFTVIDTDGPPNCN